MTLAKCFMTICDLLHVHVYKQFQQKPILFSAPNGARVERQKDARDHYSSILLQSSFNQFDKTHESYSNN